MLTARIAVNKIGYEAEDCAKPLDDGKGKLTAFFRGPVKREAAAAISPTDVASAAAAAAASVAAAAAATSGATSGAGAEAAITAEVKPETGELKRARLSESVAE